MECKLGMWSDINNSHLRWASRWEKLEKNKGTCQWGEMEYSNEFSRCGEMEYNFSKWSVSEDFPFFIPLWVRRTVPQRMVCLSLFLHCCGLWSVSPFFHSFVKAPYHSIADRAMPWVSTADGQTQTSFIKYNDKPIGAAPRGSQKGYIRCAGCFCVVCWQPFLGVPRWGVHWISSWHVLRFYSRRMHRNIFF